MVVTDGTESSITMWF